MPCPRGAKVPSGPASWSPLWSGPGPSVLGRGVALLRRHVAALVPRGCDRALWACFLVPAVWSGSGRFGLRPALAPGSRGPGLRLGPRLRLAPWACFLWAGSVVCQRHTVGEAALVRSIRDQKKLSISVTLIISVSLKVVPAGGSRRRFEFRLTPLLRRWCAACGIFPELTLAPAQNSIQYRGFETFILVSKK